LITGTAYFNAGIGCFSGIQTSNPVDLGAPNGVGVTVRGTSITIPNMVTASSGDALLIAVMDAESVWSQGATFNIPSSFSSLWKFTDATADYLAAAAGVQGLSSSGSTGTTVVTTTNGRSTDALIGEAVALVPAAP